jgi:hypothetical protein
VKSGIPVQVALEKNTPNVMLPVGLKPPANIPVSVAESDCPRVIVLGYTDATISTLTLVTVIGTMAADELIPSVTTKYAK